MICKKIILIILILFLSIPALAKKLHPESWYQDKWCTKNNGRTEVILSDNTRCDCVTTSHAIEFDFAYKWAEAIGQSLHYALKTGMRAGIVLIVEDSTDIKYWTRLKIIINHYDLTIDTWIVKVVIK